MTKKVLNCGKTYVKAHNHNDTDLKGWWEVYIKIDGVRAMKTTSMAVVSRNDKPLYNLDHLEFSDAEIFRTDWNTSVSLVRTESYKKIEQSDVYELTDGVVDPRLFLGKKLNPTNKWLQLMMKKYNELGHEGIVIRKGAKWTKVVPLLMADVRILGMKPGAGRLTGVCGSITTAHGSIGSIETQYQRHTGIPISDIVFREYLWNNKDKFIHDGVIIQVGYRETTSAGKLRFPKFVRFRFDKDEESLT
jgi:hypothetical protein